jgi:hypothetical protein
LIGAARLAIYLVSKADAGFVRGRQRIVIIEFNV